MKKGDQWAKKFATLSGTILCLLAVAIGAFGSHALSDVLIQNQRTDTFELANRYHFYHAFGLLLIAGLGENTEITVNKTLRIAISCLFFGTLVFCSSLYSLALSNLTYLGAITPVGGALLIFGWATLVADKYNSFKA